MPNPIQYPFGNDHDIFIALIQEFNDTIQVLDKRMLEDHNTTLEVKGLLQQQYESLSTRMTQVENDLLEINPKDIAQLKKTVEKHDQWIGDFNKTKHIAWVIASSGFFLMGHYLPGIITGVLHYFK